MPPENLKLNLSIPIYFLIKTFSMIRFAPLIFILNIYSSLILPSELSPLQLSFNGGEDVACPLNQLEATPCRCCKMDCWYSISKSATHELGHIPGQEGEDEAMATLKLIRLCMIEQCSEICPKVIPRQFRLRPLNPLLANQLNNNNQQLMELAPLQQVIANGALIFQKKL